MYLSNSSTAHKSRDNLPLKTSVRKKFTENQVRWSQTDKFKNIQSQIYLTSRLLTECGGKTNPKVYNLRNHFSNYCPEQDTQVKINNHIRTGKFKLKINIIILVVVQGEGRLGDGDKQQQVTLLADCDCDKQ